jgi:hypothetical protein
MSAPFGARRGVDINNDDRKDVQPHPVDLWPETRPVVGRPSASFAIGSPIILVTRRAEHEL